MKTRSDFEAYELDWFAVDAEGCISLFSSAGWGPIPDFVFEHFEGQREIERHLNAIAEIASSYLLNQTFDALLKQGIFCFDWTDTFGPYLRHNIPSQTINVAQLDLPSPLRKSFVLLPLIQFRLAAELQAYEIPDFTDVSRTA